MMMRLVLILGVFVLSAPVFAQNTVTGFSKSSLESSNTSLEDQADEALMEQIRERIDNGIVLKSGRRYQLVQNTVLETVTLNSGGRLENAFDFDNGILFVRSTDANRGGYLPVPFSELGDSRARDIKAYGCFIAKSSRSSEAAFFVETHCE